jgi:GxxExxY protein
MTNLLYKNESYKLQGALLAVRRKYGRGLKENIMDKICIEQFTIDKIPFLSKPKIHIYSQDSNKKIGMYVPDFLIYDKIVLEIKSVSEMPKIFESQLYNYLRCSKYELGYIVNFGAYEFDIRRRIFTNDRKSWLV